MTKDNRLEPSGKSKSPGAAFDNLANGQSPDGEKTAQNDTPSEKNGPKGPEPTRYGDWEKGGRCTDF